MKAAFPFVFLFLSACASKPVLPSGRSHKETAPSAESFLVDEAGPSEPSSQDSEIRPGYLLSIESPVDKALNLKTRVALEGDTKLPYELRWVVAGTSVKNLAAKLNDHFRTLYKVPPQIRVEVVDRKYYIDIRGSVEKAGPLLVKERERIEDVLRRAGERKNEPAPGFVQVKRGENSFNISLAEYFQGRGLDRSPKWFGGEKVLFLRDSTALTQEDTNTIQLIGDVRAPGPVAFKNQADIYHYLLKAGGTTPTTDLDRVEVVRHLGTAIHTTAGSALAIARNIQLEPGDTIIMGSRLPGQTERRLQILSVLASAVSAIAVLTLAL